VGWDLIKGQMAGQAQAVKQKPWERSELFLKTALLSATAFSGLSGYNWELWDRREVYDPRLGHSNLWRERHLAVVCCFQEHVICSSCIIAYSFGLLTGFLKLLKPCYSSSKPPLVIFDLYG